jgi:hypothetical protein
VVMQRWILSVQDLHSVRIGLISEIPYMGLIRGIVRSTSTTLQTYHHDYPVIKASNIKSQGRQDLLSNTNFSVPL